MGAYAFESAFTGICEGIAQAAVAQTPCTPDPTTWPNEYALQQQLNPQVYYGITGCTVTNTNAVTYLCQSSMNTALTASTITITNNAMTAYIDSVWQQQVQQVWIHQNNEIWGCWNAQQTACNDVQQGNQQGYAPAAQAQGGVFGESRAAYEERTRRTNAAKEVAWNLLTEHLTAEQREELQMKRSFTVISKGTRRKYRILTDAPGERHGNIKLLNERNEEVESLCGAPGGNIPFGDALLGQKLMLEHAEEEFLRLANRTPLRRVG